MTRAKHVRLKMSDEHSLRELLGLSLEDAERRVRSDIIWNENGLIVDSIRVCTKDGKRKPYSLVRDRRRANVGLEKGVIKCIYKSQTLY